MRLVRLILILTKEFIIGRHLWKWSIDSLTSENFQKADHVWNRPIMHCKPLVIDYAMYAVIVCILLLTLKGLFIPDICTSFWLPDICNYYLLAPFLKKMAPKKSLQGPLWPSSKMFWLKHWEYIISIIYEWICAFRKGKRDLRRKGSSLPRLKNNREHMLKLCWIPWKSKVRIVLVQEIFF